MFLSPLGERLGEGALKAARNPPHPTSPPRGRGERSSRFNQATAVGWLPAGGRPRSALTTTPSHPLSAPAFYRFTDLRGPPVWIRETAVPCCLPGSFRLYRAPHQLAF